MDSRKLALGLVLAVSLGPTFGAELSKNGHPCVQELCVGDGLSELKTIQWEKIKSTQPSRGNSQDKVKSTYRGALNAAMPYLLSSRFDSDALPVLAGVIADCGYREPLYGYFLSSAGNKTEVVISLNVTPQDANKQEWIVQSIRRDYPDGLSPQQKNEAEKQLTERYKEFSSPSYKRTNVEKGNFSADPHGYSLFSQRKDDRSVRMASSVCTGGKKAVVD